MIYNDLIEWEYMFFRNCIVLIVSVLNISNTSARQNYTSAHINQNLKPDKTEEILAARTSALNREVLPTVEAVQLSLKDIV